MIKETLEQLINNDFYGAGKHVEIAKGKYEYISTLRDMKIKLKRLWRSKKK